MRIKIFLLLSFSGLLGLSAFAQSLNVGEDQAVPRLDGREADILGGIPNTDIDRIYRDRLDRGILIPEFGIEDVFLTKGSKETLDLERFGFICIEPTIGNIVVSRDPPGDPTVPRKSRTIEAVTEGTTMLVITERAPGQTVCKAEQRGRLLKVFRVSVTNKDVMQALLELRALIGGIEGIKLRVVGDKIVVDGEIIVPAEIERFARVMNPDGGFMKGNKNLPVILNLVQVSPLSQQYLAQKMEEQIAGGPDRPRDIRVKVVNGRFFLEGSVDRLAQREEAEKICQAYIQPRLEVAKAGVSYPQPQGEGAPTDCNNLVWVRASPTPDPPDVVSVRVDFVSLSKNYLKEFDFSWSPSITENSGVEYSSDLGRISSGFVATLSSLFPKLYHAQSHGYGRILKSVTLLTKDNTDSSPTTPPPQSTVSESFELPYQECQLDANGQQACRVATMPVSTTVKVGVRSVKGSDKINMVVDAVSESVRGDPVGGRPPKTTQTVGTNISVASGESAALGGMVTESRTVGYSRRPAAGSAVNIFDISRKHTFLDDKTQFIIFVTPTKQKTPSPGTEELKRKFRLRR